MEKDNLTAKLALIDAQFPSPDARAELVYKTITPHLKEFTEWDILCFTIQYIGWISQRFPFIEASARELNRLLYTAHYYDRNSDVDKGVGIGRVANNPEGIGTPESNQLDGENRKSKSLYNDA